MLDIILFTDLGAFFGGMVSSSLGAAFWIGLMFIAIIAFLLIKINSPAPLTLMICLILFAAVGGFTNPWIGVALAPISTVFFPVFILLLLIAGGVFAYALWRMFAS